MTIHRRSGSYLLGSSCVILAMVASAEVGDPGLSLRTARPPVALATASWRPAADAAAASDGDVESTFVPAGTCTSWRPEGVLMTLAVVAVRASAASGATTDCAPLPCTNDWPRLNACDSSCVTATHFIHHCRSSTKIPTGTIRHCKH